MNNDLLHVPLRTFQSEDLLAAIASTPALACSEPPDAARLLQITPSTDFSDLIRQIYPTHAGNFAALGCLAERLAERKRTIIPECTLDLDQSVDPPRGHAGVVGDLVVEGDLRVISTLIVTGNLEVRGTLSDCGPQSRIVVLGELSARHVSTSGWVAVMRNVRVEGLLFGKYNDDVFETQGSISAGAIVSDDHAFEASHGLEVRHRPDSDGAWGPEIFDLRDPEHLERLRDLLGAKAIDEAEELDWDHVPKSF